MDLACLKSVKNYWDGREEFADMFNAYLFDGHVVISPEELEDTDKLRLGNVLCTIKSFQGMKLMLIVIDRMRERKRQLYCGKDYSFEREGLPGIVQEGKFLEKYQGKDKAPDICVPTVALIYCNSSTASDREDDLTGCIKLSYNARTFINDYQIDPFASSKKAIKFKNQNNIDYFHILGILYNDKLPNVYKKQYIQNYERTHQISSKVKGAIEMALDIKLMENVKNEKVISSVFDVCRQEGITIGKEKGIILGKALSVIELLNTKEDVPKEIQDKILNESNDEILGLWLKIAANCDTVSDFVALTAI